MTRVHARLLIASYNKAARDILYTWELTFPRPILAEVNTHRKASRNTSSSRAISMSKLREKVRHDPFIPISIGANQKGMQAGDEILGLRRFAALSIISMLRYPALLANWTLEKLGVHKQVANRYLEPWMWCVQVFSATDVNNLLLQRNHKDAEPHFYRLAQQMALQVAWCRRHIDEVVSAGSLTCEAYDITRFQALGAGEWHLPYITEAERTLHTTESLVTLSTARCANTSYTMPDERKHLEERQAVVIVKKLLAGTIKHLSPFEHQAVALSQSVYAANFRGFRQNRSHIHNESGESLV